ncbi:MAG: hypothetical protein JW888_16275 [Pirellulales bacterium]|nr:hypothetical protein [Pirellulales bacterium]
MKSILAALGVVLLTASVASAGWAYVPPAPVVYGPAPVVANYWPVGPAYAYPAPYVVARPAYAYPAVYGYAPAPVVYASPYVVRQKVFVRGQPVRNALRAAF